MAQTLEPELPSRSPASPASRASAAAGLPQKITALLLILLLGLVFIDFPRFTAGTDLDRSWEQALGWFFKHRFQAGVDYIFSYGPFGWFYTPAHDPDLLAARYAWELPLKLLMAVVIVRAGWRIPRPAGRVLFFVTVFFLPDHPDVLHPFFIMLVGLAALGPDRPSLLLLIASSAALAVLGLVKFNLSLFALAALVVLCLTLTIQRRPLAVLLTAASFLVCFLGAWLLTGQELANLPRYLDMAREVTEGYVAAMGIEGDPGQLVHALAVTGLLVAALATCGRPLLHWQPLLLLGLLGLSFFLQWKHSFVRQGSHLMNFFAFAALLPLIFPAFVSSARPSRWRIVLAGGAVVLGLVGRVIYDPLALTPVRVFSERLLRVPNNARAILFPAGLRERLEAQRREMREKWALPKVRATVGDASIDLISCEQGVLFLNDLSYRPRPVFQSYKAYTPELLAVNARFYESDRAPDFVLLSLVPIDGRLPASEDGQTLLVIFRRYRPVLVEKSFLLLRRSGGPIPSETPGPVVLERTVRFGEAVDLPAPAGDGQTITLTVRPTAAGRLRQFLFRPAQVFLRAEIDGGPVTYRLIPGLAEGGFLLNPFIADTGDVLRLYEGNAGKRVTSFTITGSPEGPDRAAAGFADEVRIEVRRWGAGSGQGP